MTTSSLEKREEKKKMTRRKIKNKTKKKMIKDFKTFKYYNFLNTNNFFFKRLCKHDTCGAFVVQLLGPLH
jgi:hypothetical protein